MIVSIYVTFSSEKVTMVTYVHVAFIILIVLLLIFYFTQNPLCDLGLDGGSDEEAEHFDTYHNHDMGSHQVYEQHPELFAQGSINGSTVEEARLKSTYEWSKRDSRGMNVYDVMYEGEAQERNRDHQRDQEAYKPTFDEPYDMKFSTVEGSTGYNLDDMKDNMLWQQVGPFAVHLAQKGLHE